MYLRRAALPTPSWSRFLPALSAPAVHRHARLPHTLVRTVRLCGASTSHAVVVSPLRAVHTVTTAANFETEVLQSQQAICVVYYVPDLSGCNAFLRSIERLVDAINGEVASENSGDSASPTQTGAPAAPTAAGADGGPTIEVDPQHREGGGAPPAVAAVTPAKNNWLKLCVVNADENRNLASAFSVERAKLPATYFVMSGTIIDKVVGIISDARLGAILHNFVEHYQREANVDLMRRSKQTYRDSGGTEGVLPAAATADLLRATGASTAFLKDKLLAALVGADMIALPQDAPHLDGLRRTIQDAKRAGHKELSDLHQQLGMDVRRLSDAELHKHYYRARQFITMAVLCALEALFLAREYAVLGTATREQVEWARRAVSKEFAPVLGEVEMRRVMALVDANLLRGDLRTALRTHKKQLQQQSEADAADTAPRLTLDAKQLCSFDEQLLSIIDQHIDSRTVDEAFPHAVVEALFSQLKATLAQQRQSRSSPSASAASAAAGHGERGLVTSQPQSEDRAQQLKTVILCIVQLHAGDAKSQAARSRLSSLLF